MFMYCAPWIRTINVASLLFLLLTPGISFSQPLAVDSVKLTIVQAENQFLSKNLQLLAQKYNVDAAAALVLQARLYPNPNFSGEQGAYNTETRRWFETDAPNGEEATQVSQLIVLARKVKKQVDIAKTNQKLAEDNLSDLLRTLRFSLRSTYYNIYYLQQTAKVYDEEISALEKIVRAYLSVVDKGLVSRADLVMIQAQLYALKNEYQTLTDNLNDQESQLRLLLQDPPGKYYTPTKYEVMESSDPLSISVQSLIDSALQNRTDLIIATDNLLLSHQYLTYQKALAIPDPTVTAGFDKFGSYIKDFNSVSVAIDIPIFNRNQGNIKNAKSLIDFNAVTFDLTQKMVAEQVVRGLQKAHDADVLYKSIDPSFAGQFDKLAAEMITNYMKRNVNLLTFLSFYDAYKQNIVQLNTILFNKVNALESINFLTGTNIFHP